MWLQLREPDELRSSRPLLRGRGGENSLLIGVIGSKAEAREVMQEVTDFLRHHLRLEASPEKSKVSKASDGTVFLGVVRSRANADRIHLRVPRERLVRFNQRQGYGDLGRLKATHRRYLIDSSV